MFCSALRSKGDRAGFFEFDDEVGYFYVVVALPAAG
jgi:hypothetical protein